MKITWDSKAKAVYIYLTTDEGKKSEKTLQLLGHDVYLDYDKGHSVIGIELLNVESEPTLIKLA